MKISVEGGNRGHKSKLIIHGQLYLWRSIILFYTDQLRLSQLTRAMLSLSSFWDTHFSHGIVHVELVHHDTKEAN
jgi:hypothetical protein